MPVLALADVRAVSQAARLAPREFATPLEDGLQEMRSTHGACFFYEAGRCSIYAHRPVDCRLFPFDVIRDDDGTLKVIAYTSACPKPINAAPYKDDLRNLLAQLDGHIEAYADQQRRDSTRLRMS